MFDEYLQARKGGKGEDQRPFDIGADYLRYVDGKPRYEGVRSFLASRGIELPYGSPEDPPDRETVCGLGNRKNDVFRRVVREQGVDVYESTVSLIEQLRARGVRIAVASSSQNCAEIVRATGLEPLFEVRVDGITLDELGLRGKPFPDMFLKSVELLDVPPGRAMLVEDAVAGVEAGKRGGFGLVIGVDRGGNRVALREAGADVVVNDLDEVTVEMSHAWSASREHARPSAIGHWGDVRARWAGRRLAVFLDYDGTLTPIVQRPDMARLSSEMRAVLRQVAAVYPTIVVSGRGREDVARLVGVDTLYYAGSHGFDIAGPAGVSVKHEVAADVEPELAEVSRWLERTLAGVQGALVENKRFSVAVHYRLVADDQVSAVDESVQRAVESHAGLKRTSGKKVFELRPDIDWDKGKAVLWLLEALELRGPDVVPLYIGDDVTDEDAFGAIAEPGVGIVVTDVPRPTRAHYSLQNPSEVEAFLRRLAHDGRDGGFPHGPPAGATHTKER